MEISKLELTLCAAGFVLILQVFFGLAAGSLQLAVPLTAVLLLIVHLYKTHLRWQMAPLWIAVLISLLVLFTGAAPTGFGWVSLLVSCTLLLMVSTLLVIGMPLAKLPVPDGPYAVGTVSGTLIDPARPAGEGSEESGRHLYLKLWYPADPAQVAESTPERLWQEFEEVKHVPVLLKWLTGYLRPVKTHTHPAAPWANGLTAPMLLIYNHGMISIASENTLLMEHLASHGFVIIAIRHEDQLGEMRSLSEQQPSEQRELHGRLMNQLKSPLDRAERARLSLELFERSEVTNRIVKARASDAAFSLNHLAELSAWIPGAEKANLNGDKVGVFGLSLGGAVATEFCKRDPRGAAAVNLDGGLFGTLPETPVRVPYLMLSSEFNGGSNDLLLQHFPASREQVIPGSKHMDFHDAKAILPILRWAGQLGRMPPTQMLEVTQREVRSHFASHLRP